MKKKFQIVRKIKYKKQSKFFSKILIAKNVCYQKSLSNRHKTRAKN